MDVIFEEVCLSLEEKISVMREFTRTYREASGSVAAVREARCLKVQFPAVMGKIKDTDYFAGRLGGLPIGFNPQAEGMQMGYYLNEEEMKRLIRQCDTEEQKAVLRELRDFWRENTTCHKIRELYDEDLIEAVPDKNYVYERAAAYPLYRLSGTHMDFGKLLKNGADGLRSVIREKITFADPGKKDFYQSLISVLDIYTDTCLFYRDMAMRDSACAAPERSKRLKKIAGLLEHGAHDPASGFEEAIQMVLIYWLLSGSFNFGRMDEYLGCYYADDIDNGILTEEEALDALSGMWRLMIARNKPYDLRVIIGGEGRSNPDAGDRFSMLAIRASMRVHDVAPQLTLRFSEKTPDAVMGLTYEALRQGTTFPMLYPDAVNIPAVIDAFHVSEEEARQYCPFGCGEYVFFHRSLGTPSGVINLLKVLELTLNNGYDLHTGEPLGPHDGYLWDYDDFEALWKSYSRHVDYYMDQLARQEELEYEGAGRDCAFLFFSLLFDDCIERGLPLLSGGIHYLGGTIESYGNINTADSLTAIRSCVYENNSISARDLVSALSNNFEGYEEVRKNLLRMPKYGNDDPTADSMAVRVHNQVCGSARRAKALTKLHSYLVVIINNNANTVLGKHTAASADGRLAHTFMANANSPFRGSDKKGMTAMINSITKLPCNIHAGCVQNLKFSSEMFTGSSFIAKSMLKVYFDKGGSQAMVSVVRRGDLEKAIKDPDNYRNLIVRVGGFSARFVELGRAEQQEIMMRTLY